MDLRRIHYFLALAETLSLSAAVRRTGRTLKTVLAQIAALEEDLDAPLFVRSGGDAVVLTAAGQGFVEDSRRILEGLEAARETARSIAEGRSGVLRLGLCEEAATPLLSGVIRRFRAQFPGLGFHLVELPSAALASGLRRHEIDLALLLPEIDSAGLQVQTLWRDDWVVVGAMELPEREIDCQDLADIPLILSHPQMGPTGHDLIRRAFEASRVPPRVAAQGLGRSTMLALSSNGVGATFVPRSFVRARTGGQRGTNRAFRAEALQIAAAFRAADPPGVAMQFLRSVRGALEAG